MTQSSWPWPGTTIGDAALKAPYTHTFFAQMFMRFVLTYDRTKDGVIDTGHAGYTGGLQVNAGTNQVTVQTGAGIVDGAQFWNDAAEIIAIPAAVVSARIDRIVMRKHYSAADPLHPYAIRLIRLPGVEGSGVPPALTQDVAGLTYWDISLAQVESPIGGGTVVVTSEARAIRTPLGPGYQYDSLVGNVSGGFVAATWQVIGAGVKISLGPGPWIVSATLGFSAGNVADIRGVRIVNNTLAGAVICSGRQSAANLEQRTISAPETPIDLGVICELEVEFLAGAVTDTVLGDAGSNGNMTSIIATRVI